MVGLVRLVAFCASVSAFTVQPLARRAEGVSEHKPASPVQVVTIYRTSLATVTRYADQCLCPVTPSNNNNQNAGNGKLGNQAAGQPGVGSTNNNANGQVSGQGYVHAAGFSPNSGSSSPNVVVYATTLTNYITLPPTTYTTTTFINGAPSIVTVTTTAIVTQYATSTVTSTVTASASAGAGIKPIFVNGTSSVLYPSTSLSAPVISATDNSQTIPASTTATDPDGGADVDSNRRSRTATLTLSQSIPTASDPAVSTTSITVTEPTTRSIVSETVTATASAEQSSSTFLTISPPVAESTTTPSAAETTTTTVLSSTTISAPVFSPTPASTSSSETVTSTTVPTTNSIFFSSSSSPSFSSSSSSSSSSSAVMTTTTVAPPTPTQFVVNPGFEIADADGDQRTPWVFSDDNSYVTNNAGGLPSLGNYYALLTLYNQDDTSISQTLTGLTAGTEYTLEFVRISQASAEPGPFCTLSVFVDGQELAYYGGQAYKYVYHSIDVVPQSSTAVIKFEASCSSEPSGQYGLDNITFQLTG